MPVCNCPKCDADISDTYEEYSSLSGPFTAGWFCGACDLFVEDEDPDDGLNGEFDD